LVALDEVTGEGGNLSAEEAVRSEAEAIARWLKHEVVGKEVLIDADGRRRKVEPGDVAMLFRTFSQGREYLDALRRHGLAYVAEGEKHFYRRQEVVDFVNLLRCIQNPDDTVARLGLLRSALGGLTDREIVDLIALGAQDYRRESHANLDRHPKAKHLHRLYAALQTLHEECSRQPLPEALDLIFERLPLLELAAASAHGEQAVANLWKLRALTEDLVADPILTLAGLAALLAERVADPPEESESGLAEESLEAIRVLTIHKAKGLEFPIVVLVGLHAGTLPQHDPIEVHHDWSTDVVGLRFEGISTLEGVFMAEKLEARMTAERRRLLYVGMTRAKERLVLSGAVTRRRGSERFLDLCREAIGESVGKQAMPLLMAGEGEITQTIVPADEGKPRRWNRQEAPTQAVPDLVGFALRWQKREQEYQLRRANPIVVTPSSFATKTTMPGHSSSSHTPAMFLGSLIHSILNQMSYGDESKSIHDVIERAMNAELPHECHTEREEIHKEIHAILAAYLKSGAYAELCASTILAREVPFFMPWGAESSALPIGLMEGRIDLVYRQNGRLWVADYKTDRVIEAEMAGRAETYGEQARYYMQAVRAGFGEEPAGFRVIFVRLGLAVPVDI
jgi:ATP-dependent helicase/nuclease subunit A